MSDVPRLTHLQFLVTGILRAQPLPGRTVRSQLRARGVRRTGPGFYQLMARLEDIGLVEGMYHQEVVEGQIIRERHYRLTAEGLRSWEASRAFYVSAIRDFGGRQGLSDA